MRIGVLSDIHGDLAALSRVWAQLAREGLTTGIVLNAGDNVGYGKSPEKCVQFLRDHPNIVNVRGNYDKHVALFPERREKYQKKWGRLRPDKYATLRDSSAAISDPSRAWLAALPDFEIVDAGVAQIFLTHYSPGSKEGLGDWTPESRLAELARNTEARIVVSGHTHSAFAGYGGGTLFLNPGTVGRNWNKRAEYAILTLDDNLSTRVELKSI
ncbi:phosphoesterase [Capsulimonas corticalis]|uniref:Phosphoesterase n=1 Tax=Capsulimonas corticalis TaxID=2219043 RepID=A0A402CXP4_9BACT|nr:metallophosphoesterase family protein [Capsulimonas corticalis]BDI32209.1 phosphoesterase [Capsulimonas corticalis]